MDISIAKQILEVTIKNKQDELDSCKLALSILTDTYNAEFLALDQSKKEVTETKQNLLEQINQLSSEKEAIVNQLSIEQGKTAELTDCLNQYEKTPIISESEKPII